MSKNKFLIFMSMVMALVALSWGVDQGWAQSKKSKKVTTAERKAAAARAAALGLQPGVAALGVQIPDPGGVPHYFGPYGNWAYSPLPKGAVAVVTVTSGGTGYTAPTVTIDDAYLLATAITTANVTANVGTGVITGFTINTGGSGYSLTPTVTITDPTGTGANAAASVVNGIITGFTINNGGAGYVAPVVTIVDPTGVGANVTALGASGTITGFTINNGGAGYAAPVVTITDPTGTGATADAVIGGPLTGGMRKFVDRLPGLGPAGANNIIQTHGAGQYIPVAVKDITTHPGSDYYEIALVEYTEKMHSDLSPTRLRGYVQVSPTGTIPLFQIDGITPINYPGTTAQVMAVDNPHYLGPVIVAQGRAHGVAGAAGQPVPVRIKFYNLLPAGAGGNLFLPVDETVPGAGLGPAGPGTAGDKYTQNRATIHLHGNNTVWISDGNTHQWITPAGENTPYPAGVSARNVPDMGTACDDPLNPGRPGSSGCMTFFYTNAQSARLQFYHDHAMGITRLNVYGGEAAGYVLTDAVDQDMINGTNISGVNIPNPAVPIPNPTNPGDFLKVLPDIGIPLVIQDRTWVETATIFGQDPTWNWGTGTRDLVTGKITGAVDGDLWFPHVYMSAENPWDLGGVNPFGRWMYGPWFNPPVPTCVNGLPVGCIEVGPVPNEYCLPTPGVDCSATPLEPPFRPGVPNPSIPGEAFMDTPVVNGTAYPYLEVEPKAYRFRILSAANDRMFNLQLYVAADKTTPTTAGTTGTVLCTGPAPATEPARSAYYANCTEVKMRLVTQADLNQTANTPSGLPDETTKGPDWIQIGTEGGFLPAPVVVPQQPVGWNMDATVFNVGNVNQHSLLLGSAERADVVVDFSAYAGKTLILYNDAPAAFPAGVATYDYYTGVANQMDVGGAPTTQPGYGPNTRTIMQIRVGTTVSTPTPDVTLANLQAVFAKNTAAGKRGVFEVSQDPVIVPQAAYNSAYNASFPNTVPAQYGQIADTSKTFNPIDPATGGLLPTTVTLPFEMKAMHDEMSGVYDTMFGRMSGMLGLSNPLSPVHVLIPYGYSSPPTDVVKGSVEGTPVGALPDGTQIWRIFHNGVDTHTIHTHLFHTQLLNRVSQDGLVMMPPDPEELGWKDTFRVNPLEITYLAMRPTVPLPTQLPFEAPDSVRLIDPTLPEGATLPPPAPAGWFDPDGVAITEILNHYVNFGWEYVWHCHILAHEEMDMMHSLVFAIPPRATTLNVPTVGGTANNPRVTLTFTDNSLKEQGFTIQRASDANFTTGLTPFAVPAATGSGTTVTFTDTTVQPNNIYWYRVFAIGAPVGDTQAYPGSLGFPTMAADSVSGTQMILVGTPPGTPNAPGNLAAALQTGPQVSLTWRDNATNETGFSVERCTGAGCTNFTRIAVAPARNNTGNTTYLDTTVTFGNTYLYRVAAVNSAGLSAYSPIPPATVSVAVPAIPAAPTSFTVSAAKANGNNYTATLNWASAANPTNFTIQRANNATFTTGLTAFTAAGTVRSLVQTVTRNTVYYYRIRANNNVGGSSAWTNALPFPIRTGP